MDERQLGEFMGEMRTRMAQAEERDLRMEGKIDGLAEKFSVLDRWQQRADAKSGTIAAIVAAVIGLISWLFKG